MNELYLGLISGTSVDGIDAVLVEFAPDGSPRLLASHDHVIPESCKRAIAALCQSGPDEVERLGRLDRQLGELLADAALTLLGKTGVPASAVKAIGSHGQTVRHQPEGADAFTLQIGDPNTVAARTSIPVIADFRRKDMALGGQGAPLVPAFHHAVFRSSSTDRIVLNLGGIANITVLPRDPVSPVYGYDTGPANTLMDLWCREHLGKHYDEDGAWAGAGKVDERLLERLLAEAYFRRQPPKSTGRELFHRTWLAERLSGLPPICPQDVQASLLELTVRTVSTAIVEALPQGGEVFACGGGARNRRLLERLRELLPKHRVSLTDELGVGSDWVEAMAFAWLARRHVHGLPGNLPTVTGARREAVLGGYYPA